MEDIRGSTIKFDKKKIMILPEPAALTLEATCVLVV